MKNLPKISILIRNLNEEENLKILFPLLNNQKYDNFEVVFLDSGSTDNSVDFVRTFKGNFKVISGSIKKEDFTFGKALNICANLAQKPEYIISLSSHCFPTGNDFLQNYINNFEKYQSDIVYGKQIGFKDSMVSEANHLIKWFDDNYGIKSENPFSNNGNCGYKFSLWEDLKFNEELTGCEDIDFAMRAIKENKIIAYGENITVNHYHNENSNQIFNRYFREALALNSIYKYKYTWLKFVKSLLFEITNDFLFYINNNDYTNKSISDIFIYRFNKINGQKKGFNRKVLNRNQIYNYKEDFDTKLMINFYNKYLY